MLYLFCDYLNHHEIRSRLHHQYHHNNLDRDRDHHHHRHRTQRFVSNNFNNFIAIIFTLLITLQFQMTIISSTIITQQHQQHQQSLTTTTTSPGVYMVRSPESIVAPKGDEVLFECELNLEFERLDWRFKHANWKSNTNEFHNLHKNDGYNITNDERISKLRIYVSSSTLGDYQCVAWFGSVAIASVTAKLTLATISLEDNYSNNNDYSDSVNNRIGIRTTTWTVTPKNSVLIKCGNVISNPPPVWNFYKDNVSISQTIPQLPSGALVLDSITTNSSGIYTCSAINAITGIEVQLPQKIHLNVQNTQKLESPHFLITPLRKFIARPEQTVILECPGIGNPVPKAIWSSPDVDILNNQRLKTLNYGLQILNVTAQDRGNYTCRLDNGLSKALIHSVQLEVLELPEIIKGPQSALMNESDYLELECIAQGSPQPEIYWMINGRDTRWDELIKHKGAKLIISKLEKRHAGIVQCFAKNEAGETYESNLLQVKPKQIGMQPYGIFPTRSTYDHIGKQNKGRKKHKIPNMIPPSRPNVTRLSDDSVMIRWYVPKNDGLPIQFFKVQYRMLGDPSRKIPRENWQTTNDDIPYGKRGGDKNGGTDGFVKNFTSAVIGLKPDRYYRFRIIAVYSNNDNKEGNSSGKFLLQKASQLGLSKNHLPPPTLTRIEGISETEIVLHWTYPINNNKSNPIIEGFYAYYRSASTAGEYSKATIEGMHIRHFKIDMLEPGTAYEFKLQSFTSSAASDFSSILTGRTLKPPTTPSSLIPSVIPASEASKDTNSMFPVIAATAGGSLLLLLAAVAICFCFRRRKNPQQEDENKPQIDHIQVDGGNHFGPPTTTVMGGGGGQNHNHKSNHRINGVIPRMNITPNPLAQEGDKNRNVMMELRFMPSTPAASTMTTTTATGTAATGGLSSNYNHHHHHHHLSSHHQIGLPSSPASSSSLAGSSIFGVGGKLSQSSITSLTTTQQCHQPSNYHHPPASPPVPQSPSMLHKSSHHHSYQQQQQSNNNNNHHVTSSHHLHHQQQQQQPPPPLTPLMDQHRRTLERSIRNLPYATASTLDQADGIPPPTTRIPSLRRTRRTSGSTNNNNGGVGIPPSSPRVQRSPPIRSGGSGVGGSSGAVKSRNRLGSHTENISSGSLNSIEV